MGLFSNLINLFSSAEGQVLRTLKKQRKVITQAGGGYKILSDYMDENYSQAIYISMNEMGLGFEKDPGRSILNLAVLDLLYEAKSKFLEKEIFSSLSGRTQESNSSEIIAEDLIKTAQGNGYQKTDLYKVARSWNSLVARLVTYEEAIARNEVVNSKNIVSDDVELNFDRAKRVAAAAVAEFLLHPDNNFIVKQSMERQVKVYSDIIRKTKSDVDLEYWQKLAAEKQKKAEEAFEKWEKASLNDLKMLVRD